VPPSSQISATQAQVASIEATITKEQQQAAALDQQYDGALQELQAVQAQLAVTTANLVRARAKLAVDRKTLAEDAVNAYVFGTPDSGLASIFTTQATKSDARSVYQDTVVGDLTAAAAAVQTQQTQLGDELVRQQTEEHQASDAATQAQNLRAANEAATAATEATLHQVQGTLAQQVAAAAEAQAQADAAAAAAAQNQAAAQAAAAAAASAAGVAGAVGGSGAGAAATSAANQAAAGATNGTSGNSGTVGAGGNGSGGPSSVGGTTTGTAAGASAVQAAESQLGVPYVFGGETPGVGFDCSGLTQWAWAQAGVTIPRTAASQWASLSHVALTALEPGDLLFYYNLDGDNTVDHVVMYVGSGPYADQTIIQAPFTGETVSYSPVFTEDLVGAARP